MSYLDLPRLTFAGFFQADVSTINNGVGYFDNDAFKPEFQQLGFDGSWNPEGTAIFRLVECTITGARLGDQQITDPAQDPVIGMALENADDRVFGKLVDLDPQQQMVSQIWGMRLRLTDGVERALFAGDYAPAAFLNLWRRQQHGVQGDQTLAAIYQSVLRNVVWHGRSPSKVLEALQRASEQDALSINMNVYGFGRNPAIPRYTMGRVAGVIGPYRAGEPKHFVLGRQMVAGQIFDQSAPLAAQNGVFTFQCKVHADRKTVTADFGNSLQIVNADGALVDVGQLVLAVSKVPVDTVLASVAADQVAVLGNVNYRQAGWYASTAGVQEFDYSADPWSVAHIGERPLLLLTPQPDNSYKVLVQESLGGLYVRADEYVYRLAPDATGEVELHATRFGAPLAADIALSANTGAMGGSGGPPPPPDVPIPDIATPDDGVSYPDTIKSGPDGKAVLKVKAGRFDPRKPRGYLAGQLYGIGYQLAQQPAQTISNFWNFISVFVYSPTKATPQPTWYADIQPILQQYGNLYPIMSKHLVRLGDYDSVVAHLDILKLAFSLPITDPNHMPVTRDLSPGDRAMILTWMTTPGADGLPLKGQPPPAAVAAARPRPAAAVPSVAVDLEPQLRRGKTGVITEFIARRQMKGKP
jgi:hypothetical protein